MHPLGNFGRPLGIGMERIVDYDVRPARREGAGDGAPDAL
jgi:hypothetical protein